MKRIVLTLLFAFSCLMSLSQAKKPIIMVMPDDSWCNRRGYMNDVDVHGQIEKVTDYDRALLEDYDLKTVITMIGGLMSDRGFPLKDLDQTLKSLKQQAAEESVTESKSGDVLAETAVEKLRKVAKADIILYLSWNVEKVGPQKSIRFTLQGIDAYTNKQVASASGTGEPTTSNDIAVMLEEAVLTRIEPFNVQLQAHFDDMAANGREVSLLCKRWSSSEFDFESEVNGDELGILIEDWVAENTVQGRFSTSDYSQNILSFEQVRIPLYNESGRAIDTRRWANELAKYLRTTLVTDVKLTTKGLGQAIITVGEK